MCLKFETTLLVTQKCRWSITYYIFPICFSRQNPGKVKSDLAAAATTLEVERKSEAGVTNLTIPISDTYISVLESARPAGWTAASGIGRGRADRRRFTKDRAQRQTLKSFGPVKIDNSC